MEDALIRLRRELLLAKLDEIPAGTNSDKPKNTNAKDKISSSSGSGFVVAANTIVTNAHVVDNCSEIRVRQRSLDKTATLLTSSQQSDLALLSISGGLETAAPFRHSAELGEDVMLAGYPLSGVLSSDLIVTSGQVNSLAGLENDSTRIQISAPVQPGNSGGPLIDRSGGIVGVIVSKLNVSKLAKVTGDFAQNINFAIKPEILRLFLDANQMSYRTSTLGTRLEGTEIAKRARIFTVQVICIQ